MEIVRWTARQAYENYASNDSGGAEAMNDLAEMLGDEPGDPLPDALRERMEAAFNADFRDVRVHTGERAWAVNRSLGGLACTDGVGIAFAPGIYRPDRPSGQFVIAHELAHVVQKRLGVGTKTRDGCYEKEADLAALATLANSPHPVLTPDGSISPRLWGTPGHYYTVYFTALCCGIAPDLAAQLAYLAQLPDELVDLDAKELGIKWAKRKYWKSHRAHPAMMINYQYIPAEPEFNFSSQETIKWLQIQRGMHCLTGGSASDETARREKILAGLTITSLEFGMGLHAYGDSWAHRNGSHMYVAPLGHTAAFVSHKDVLPKNRELIEERKGCAVDKLHYRVEDYVKYGLGLLNILRNANQIAAATPGGLAIGQRPRKPALSSDGLEKELRAVAAIQNDALQIAYFRERAKKLTDVDMSAYRPETTSDASEWEMLDRQSYSALLGNVGRLESLAISWSGQLFTDPSIYETIAQAEHTLSESNAKWQQEDVPEIIENNRAEFNRLIKEMQNEDNHFGNNLSD